MRDVIDGRVYDTSQARKIGCRSYGEEGDLTWVKETLYKKWDGEIFLHGEGRLLTWYYHAERQDGKIIPEKRFNVKTWVQRYLDSETFAHFFGPAGSVGIYDDWGERLY